ncbi:MAG TPA: hypothetical protein VGJ13_05230 [Pseudonocardiaceae bacterium]|jgi:hypothetical protein
MPDGAVTGVQVEGARTGRTTNYQGRIVEVTNPQHEKALRDLGAFPVNLGGQPAGGYRCGSCGFVAYFTTCGRCGASCHREEPHDACRAEADRA